MADKRYAIVAGGQVIGLTVWDAAKAPDWKPLKGKAVEAPAEIAVDWCYTAAAGFTPPPAAPAETAEALIEREIVTGEISERTAKRLATMIANAEADETASPVS